MIYIIYRYEKLYDYKPYYGLKGPIFDRTQQPLLPPITITIQGRLFLICFATKYEHLLF